MIATDRQRPHACSHQPLVEGFDVGMAEGKIIAALHWHIADVRDPCLGEGRALEDMIVRADPLDGPHRARSEAASVAVRHSEVHRDADERDVEAAEIRQVLRIRAVGRVEQRGNPREGPLAPVGAHELGRATDAKWGSKISPPEALAYLSRRDCSFLESIMDSARPLFRWG